MGELVAIKQIDRSKLNRSIEPVTRGNGSAGFFEMASRALKETPEYMHMLEQANLSGLDSASVHSGFIAGLRAAVELVGIELQFVQAVEQRKNRELY